jgi:hypothetical protein
MQLENSALTALLVSLVITLIKVVEFFLKKRTDVELKETKVLLIEATKEVAKLKEELLVIKECATESLKGVGKIYDMHNVYTSNHIPVWYVPGDLLSLVQSTNSDIKFFQQRTTENIEKIGDGQSIVVEKISDLINSQRLMTERLGDLIKIFKENKLS